MLPDNPKPSSPGNGDKPAGVDNAAVRLAGQNNGNLLQAIPVGWQVLLAVNVPPAKQGGGYVFDLSRLSVAAPQGFPKSLVTSIEAAVERWAEATRQAMDARKIVTL